LGCWNDRPDRQLKGSNQGRPHDKNSCGAKAVELKHKYFSVQDGNECYTGNEQYDRYGRAEGDCPPGGGAWKAHTWATKQVDPIARGLDEQKPPKKGWFQMGENKYARCYTIEHNVHKSLDECKDLCVNGDKTNPGNNACNTINFQRKTDKSESLCSTHKCKDVNKPNMHKKIGTDVYSWFGL